MESVQIHKGRHLNRTASCRHCRRPLENHVEKGIDVRAATLCVHAACMKLADRLILVANDNDYLPAIELSTVVGAHVTLAYVVSEPSDHRYVVSMRDAATSTLVIDAAFMEGMWLERPPEDRARKQR